MTQEEHNALQQMWAERVADFQASGQSRPQWAAAHGVTVPQLVYWIRKFRSPTSGTLSSSWMAWPSSPATTSSATLMVRVGSAEIRVDSDFDPQLLQAVVRALSS